MGYIYAINTPTRHVYCLTATGRTAELVIIMSMFYRTLNSFVVPKMCSKTLYYDKLTYQATYHMYLLHIAKISCWYLPHNTTKTETASWQKRA